MLFWNASTGHDRFHFLSLACISIDIDVYVWRTWQNLVILKLFGDYVKIFQALQDFSTNLLWTLYFQTGFSDLGQISRPLQHLKDMNRTFFFLGMSMSGFILMTVWKKIIVFPSFNFEIKNYTKSKQGNRSGNRTTDLWLWSLCNRGTLCNRGQRQPLSRQAHAVV